MDKTIYSKEYELFRMMIREERERLNLTQTQLAEKLKKHQPFVARVETGQRRLDVVEFIHVMRAMGVVPVEFLAMLEKRIRHENRRRKSST